MTLMSTPDATAHSEEQEGNERELFWSRIAQQLSEAIGNGEYAPGQRLPSENALARQFGVNRHTIRRSLASLAQRGLVRSSQGSGTFVEAFAVELALGKRPRHSQSLSLVGLRGRLKVIQSRTIQADPDQAHALFLPIGSPLLYLQVLGEGAGHPLHVSSRYFPLPRFARMHEFIEVSGSITEAFAQHGVLDYLRKESRISARMPDHGVSQLLGQAQIRPALLVSSVNMDTEGTPIEYSNAWFAGDRVTLTVTHHEI